MDIEWRLNIIIAADVELRYLRAMMKYFSAPDGGLERSLRDENGRGLALRHRLLRNAASRLGRTASRAGRDRSNIAKPHECHDCGRLVRTRD